MSGTVKILDLYCGHTARRVNQYAPFGVMCSHCGTRQVVLRWTDTGYTRKDLAGRRGHQ